MSRTAGQRIVPMLFGLMAAFTGVLAARQLVHALDRPSANAWLEAVYGMLRTGVSGAFALFTIGREASRKRSRSPVAFAACAVAMVSVVAFGDPPRTTPAIILIAGELIAVLACVWLLVAVVSLGRCFGVLPEARGLVTRGPYRVVRHPVYLGEIGACIGLVIAALTLANALLLAVLVAAQAVRMRLEESALREAFPEYESYARRTPRIVPQVRKLGNARGARVGLADLSA